MKGRQSRRVVASSLVSVVMLFNAARAVAFSPEGHMVTGAVAFAELSASSPHAVAEILHLMLQHPDRGSFEVTLGRTSGDERARRLFMEMARWPDDVRHGEYDHPTWHYSSTPLIDPRHPPRQDPKLQTAGSAAQAWALALSIVRDVRAPAPERAVALCWLFHLIGDMHQPLHAADAYSEDYPVGDEGGNLRYVIDPHTQMPSTLHWYWDQAASRSSDAAARADELRAKFPRAEFTQLQKSTDESGDFSTWAAESHALAGSEVYRADLHSGTSERLATTLPAAYVSNSERVAARQLTLSGYRLTDLLLVLFPA